jgi:pepF/M3 family oligoendopeptidase
MTLSVNWDLDSIFAGGSQSAPLAAFLDKLAVDLAAVKLPSSLTLETEEEWTKVIHTLYDLGARLHQANSFIECLTAQNVKDEAALQIQGQIDQLATQLGTIWTQFAALCAQQKDQAWERLLTGKDLKEVAFYLNEQRNLARLKLDPVLEMLANDLSKDGYHAWGRLYSVVSGTEEVTFQGEPLSLGQLQHKFVDDPDRTTRQQAFALYEQTWADIAKTCALALNYQAGFRLTLYKHRQWDSVLKEPLLKNRLKATTLEAMWSVIDAKSAKLLDFFAAKAKVLGLEQLSWFDVYAPIGEVTQTFTYPSAADFVVENLHQLNPNIADYARHAIDEHWVEAEDRPGKQAGAFCTSLPLSRQSRIFMTYNGSYSGMLTLAHELGHGYHSWVMRDLPYGASHYAMSLAETASTFNELIVTQASLKAVESDRERLRILGTKLDDAAAFLMDVRSRFDFELAFFRERAKKQLSVADLSELMLAAQKTAFKEGLAQYHPLFWASKLHFYITEYPFYNFPYTFGYLFSTGLYAQALAEGPNFQRQYIALLRDTGSMTTEDLAKTHLGLDLSKPEFWEIAVDRALADVDEFCRLADQLGD